MALGFGLLAVMAAVLVAVAAFGLNVATRSIDGITGRLIPANLLASDARFALLQSRTAMEALVAAVGDNSALATARAEWDAAHAALDKAAAGYGQLIQQADSKAELARFHEGLKRYRQAAAPALAALAAGQLADAAAARAALAGARQHYDTMYADMDASRSKVIVVGQAVVQKVDGAMANIRMALLALCALATLSAVVLSWRITRSVVGPVQHARAQAERLAQGDLRPGTPGATGHDELAQMLSAMAATQEALARVVGQVREAAEQIGQASAEVASGNGDLSQRTEQTAAQLQRTASAMEQISATVRQTAELARNADQLARQARDAAERGGQAVAEVVGTMSRINDSSRRIVDIIGVIDGIAFQTNILALNAAVEAARAGEQGRGFAVVAGEVRTLAQRSAEAAREIKGLIGHSVEQVDEGTRRVQAAGSTMDEIVGSVDQVGRVIGEISSAAGEQSAGMGHIATAVNDLDRNTQQNAALVEQGAAAAQSLNDQARRLVGVVSSFRLA